MLLIYIHVYIYLYSYNPYGGTHQEMVQNNKVVQSNNLASRLDSHLAWHIISSLSVFVSIHVSKVSGMSTFSQTTGTHIESFAGSITFRTRVIVIVLNVSVETTSVNT